MSRIVSKPVRKPRARMPGVDRATLEAVRTGQTVDAKSVFVLPLSRLVAYDNPRLEPEKLYHQGYILLGDPEVETPAFGKDDRPVQFVSLLHLALSKNSQHVRTFVRLMEESEQVDRERHPSAPQTIAELAEDIRVYGQLEPIKVHEAPDGMHADDGGRRICAVLLLHARSRLAILDKAPDAPDTPHPAAIQATTLESPSEGDRFLRTAKINLSRKEFTPLQEGRVYHRLLSEVNPDTLKGGPLYDPRHPKGRAYTMREAADRLRVHYSTFRNREALWHEFRILKRDAETGKALKRRGLTDEERRQVAEGTLLATYASRLSLGESTSGISRNEGRRSQEKQRALTLREMEQLFDATPSDQKDRRIAIADCMRKDYHDALRESRARVEVAVARAEREMSGGRGRKRNGKAA